MPRRPKALGFLADAPPRFGRMPADDVPAREQRSNPGPYRRADERHDSVRSVLRFHVNPSDELPIYRQLVRQVVAAIAGGHLGAGDRLPSHRELSEQLVIAPLTVKKAYDELERGGYIEMARGQGTFVTQAARGFDDEEKLERVRPLACRLANEAAALGLDVESVLRLVRDAASELRERKKERKEP